MDEQVVLAWIDKHCLPLQYCKTSPVQDKVTGLANIYGKQKSMVYVGFPAGMYSTPFENQQVVRQLHSIPDPDTEQVVDRGWQRLNQGKQFFNHKQQTINNSDYLK